MKKAQSLLKVLAIIFVSNAFAGDLTLNTLTPEEKKSGWKLLWDGKTSNGWRSARSTTFPQEGWIMKEGILTILDSGGAEGGKGGDIITTEKYSNFELVAEFKITKGANSGIKYFVDPEINKGPGSSIGLEFQVLDDVNHPDAKLGLNGNRTIGSLYDLIPAISSKKVAPTGEWNTARIISKQAHVEHWLNGIKVVEYDRFTEAFRTIVSKSKYEKWPGFGELKEGHILLQDHGNEVSYRNLKIRVLQ